MDMGKGEERVRCMERTWKLTLPYRLPMGICYMAKRLKQGWDGGGGGWEGKEEGHVWLICVDKWQKPT